MKTWTDDNPKAGLLMRKREAILVAARRQFLAHGYGGTSMEGVAAAAGVSIMTLYRHAESKDELFAAVVAIACHNPDEPEPDLSQFSLADILTGTAIGFQEKLTSPETVALLRAVIAEQERFPELATITYDATLGHLTDVVDQVLAGASEARGVAPERLTEITAAFVDDLFGVDTLRVLLGLSGRTSAQQRAQADVATRRLLAALEQPAA